MKLNKIIIAAFFTMVFVGCSDDFLETEPTEFISVERASEISEINPGIQLSNLRGAYSLMYQTGSGGTTNHDDFGQKGYDIFSDMLSGDMVLSAKIYGWYGQLSDYQVTIDFTNTRNYMVWRYYYRVILGANTIIDGLGGTDAEPELVEGQRIMGQAKALRAYAYFYLVNFFAEDLSLNEPTIPLYDNSLSPNQPLSTLDEVFALIESDLTTAVEYLEGFSRPGLFAIDEYVAKGLLAYTYAALDRNAEAAALAKDIIDNSGYDLLASDEVTNGFNTIENNNWMWGVDLTEDIGLDLISWWGQMDIFTYSYAWVGDTKTINPVLLNSMSPDDARLSQFRQNYYLGYWEPTGKFYAPDRVIGGQRTVTTDYVYMRIEEFYILHAETAAKAGDLAGARTSLTALMGNRVPDASYIGGLGQQALIDEAILQGRIELWGEGKSYLSVKRNKRTITVAPNHLTFPGEQIPADDDRMTFDIPQLEIQNNPEID
ncbi:RagB/SusD family nutrient uptake outer membrane protein [Marivirga sp.]|uniref:RagB/SusD family nutrient uptake outer membrane protein n=1 Tax=Marivirga sp. TaxID=2018662 RepID=UPI002D7F1448|nr:RagB/SusD family nutrient uptake outer membrane protein [Marivirga sp.]HET8858622.1 RagB/SusD family nutrient uptake outer membrane protein [Marivirga sp.]